MVVVSPLLEVRKWRRRQHAESALARSKPSPLCGELIDARARSGEGDWRGGEGDGGYLYLAEML